MEQVTPTIAAPVNTPAAAPAAEAGQKAEGFEIGNAKAKTEAPAEKKEPQYFERVVNGQTRRYTAEQLLERAAVADSAHERWEEAAKMRKEVEDWKSTAQTDFLKALQDPKLGLSKDQIRQQFEKWYFEQVIEPESLSPAEKKAREVEEKLKGYQEKEETDKKSAEQRQQDALDLRAREEVQSGIIETLEKSDLPKTRFMANRVAYWMRQNIKAGYDAPMDVVLSQVREERDSIVRSYAEAATPQQLVEALGESVIKKLRQFDLGQLKSKFGQTQESPKPKKEQTGRKTMADVDKYFNEMRRQPIGRRP